MSDAPLDPRLILQAAIDGELDAAGQATLEQRLADDPDLAAEYARHMALRRVLRAQITRDHAPAGLRARLNTMSKPESTQSARPPRRDFMKMAAALVVGAGLGGSATFLALGRRTPGIVDALIASHRRALLAVTPVDVASNDRHNVRPWFDARIAISPPVPDLAAQGFPLLGGRVDVVNGAPAPVLVYRLGAHVVSVAAIPGVATAVQATADAGFHVLPWHHSGFTFWMVTDADQQEFGHFAEAFQAAVANTPSASPSR
ncbi:MULTISPECIES: anti-sigma factor [unclassified Beijerinckia]|uniref:anti-sigma factor family protein n=1 Tax=unclassified Beijerinckia TaxID=2638183 RepID=UPI000895D497|nr:MULTISPECIES: anti-sigma factor [unclassified Beijerinckia]MDH7796721.1 anti-sigma factor RsiW [Beijerinckia sp. GAS462]SEC57151.1 Tat (twin-arginine translocation) pathway signal sequence [Beijerinckia sp. 28-YEA-48]